MLLCDNHWKFWTFSILQLWNKLSEKRKPFSKNWSTVYLLKALRLKTQQFYTKLLCQKAMLMQIEWGVQNEPITKNEDLPVTTLFFRKFCFSLRTSYKEVIWCTNQFILFKSVEVCGFHFVEVFHFIEIQFTYCLYLQKGLEFFN